MAQRTVGAACLVRVVVHVPGLGDPDPCSEHEKERAEGRRRLVEKVTKSGRKRHRWREALSVATINEIRLSIKVAVSTLVNLG